VLADLSTNDEYGFWNVTAQGAPVAVPPFALSFSSTAMQGHALAAGDEEGIVTILDTRRNLGDQMHEPAHPRFTAHDNAIFDICWLDDDCQIATASGDATVRVFDVETSTRRALLRGHTGSAKCVRPCPSAPYLLFTAARDGNILGFDMRTPAESNSFQETYHPPVLKIAHPHMRNVRYLMTQSIGRKRRRVQIEGPPTARLGSVTSLVFSPMNHAQLFSAGASDGAVKLWDTRFLRSGEGKVNAASPEMNTPVACVVPGNELRRDDPFKAGRPHGIANIDVDPLGKRLLVSSTDSTIYTYNASDIQLGYEKVLTGHTQTSFYIRARFSPDGNFVLSGSADSKAYIWDLQKRSVDGELSPILELAGHRGGEASAVDWCKTDLFKVATCADDSTTKVWTLGAGSDDNETDAAATLPTIRARAPVVRERAPRKRPRAGGLPKSCHRLYREQDIRTFFVPAAKGGDLCGSSSSLSSCDGIQSEPCAGNSSDDNAVKFDNDVDGELMTLAYDRY
jgi:denticleless